MLELPKPTKAFIGVSWAALGLGVIVYFFGLSRATIGLGEKGYYVILMLYGLFSVISLQKTVRDQQQGIPVTRMYYGIAWLSVIICLCLMAIGLWNATFTLSEKGFYGIAFALSLFAAVTVQKNVRDAAVIDLLQNGDPSLRQEQQPWYRTSFTKWKKATDELAGHSVEEETS